jgi:hypothetical protein
MIPVAVKVVMMIIKNDNKETVDDESDYYDKNNDHDEAQNDDDYKPATRKITNFNIVRRCWHRKILETILSAIFF